MGAKYVLAILAVVFAAAAILRVVRDGGRVSAASRTWLIVTMIFALVSSWLWLT